MKQTPTANVAHEASTGNAPAQGELGATTRVWGIRQGDNVAVRLWKGRLYLWVNRAATRLSPLGSSAGVALDPESARRVARALRLAGAVLGEGK